MMRTRRRLRLGVTIAAAVLCAGCTTYQYGPARVSTFLTRGSIEELLFTTGTNGVTLRVTGYNKDEVSGAEAVAEGAARGAVQGMAGGTPTP